MPKKFLPLQLAGPRHGELTLRQTSAVVRIAHALDAPPDWPAAQVAFAAVVCTLESLLARDASHSQEAQELTPELRGAVVKFAPSTVAEAKATMAGRTSKHPAWHCFVCIVPECSSSMLAILGAELVLALRLMRCVRTTVVKRVSEFAQEGADPVQKDAIEERSRAYLAKLIDELAISSSVRPADPRQLLLNSRILASLAHQLQDPNLSDRQAADPNRVATVDQAAAVARQLRLQAEAGDVDCLPIILAHCSGIGVGLIEDVPFTSHCEDGWIARIDVQRGIVQVDFSRIARGAKPKPGHVPASGVVSTHLPMFAASLLFEVAASNPQARCIRDLASNSYTARAILRSADGATEINVAQFIRSRASVALHAGVDRAVAAVAVLEFSLVGFSTLNYTTVTAEETWRANQRRYAALGWGEPVPLEGTVRLAVGSAVTPTVETIRKLDCTFVSAVESLRPGRHCTAERLIAFHNAYARLCAHRIAFFVAGRAAEEFGFHADWMNEECGAAFLIDKQVGPHNGKLRLAMPVRMSSQIALWKSHLRSLSARLEKSGHPLAGMVSTRVGKIQALEHAPLLFLIGAKGPQPFGSSELQAQHPGLELNSDARRHFVMNALRDREVSFTMASAHLRHHIRGLAVTEYGSQVVPLHLLDALAKALDRIALDLGMHPVPGLRKGRDI